MRLIIRIVLSLIPFIIKSVKATHIVIPKNLEECFDKDEIEMVRQFTGKIRSRNLNFPTSFYSDETVSLYNEHFVQMKKETERLCRLLREKCTGVIGKLEIKYISSKLRIETTLLQGFIDNHKSGNSIDLASEALSPKRHQYPSLLKLINEEMGHMLDFIVYSSFKADRSFDTIGRAAYSISKLRCQLSREIYDKKANLNYNLIRITSENNTESQGLSEWDKVLSSTLKKPSNEGTSKISYRAVEVMAAASIAILQCRESSNFHKFLPLSFIWNFKKEDKGDSYSCLAIFNFNRMANLLDKTLENCQKEDFLLQRFRYSLDVVLTYWRDYFSFSNSIYNGIVKRGLEGKGSIHNLSPSRVEYFYPYDEVVALNWDFLHLISIPGFFRPIFGEKEIFEVANLIVVRDTLEFFYKQIFYTLGASSGCGSLDIIEEIMPRGRNEQFLIFEAWYLFRKQCFESNILPNFLFRISDNGDFDGLSSLISFGENLILFMESCLKYKHSRKGIKFDLNFKQLELGITVFWSAAKELGIRSNPRISAIVVILANLSHEFSSKHEGIVSVSSMQSLA